eukprot:7387619-Prymnesium_polylepis.1
MPARRHALESRARAATPSPHLCCCAFFVAEGKAKEHGVADEHGGAVTTKDDDGDMPDNDDEIDGAVLSQPEAAEVEQAKKVAEARAEVEARAAQAAAAQKAK